MRTVVLASLRVHARRYVAALLAVVIGVGFVVAVAGLAGAAKRGLRAEVAAPYAGADVVVEGLDPAATTRLLTEAGSRGWAATSDARAYGQVRVGDRLVPGDDVAAAVVADDAALRWQRLTAGRFPRAAGGALVDARVAEREDVAPGDRLTFSAGGASVTATVVGLARSSVAGNAAPLYLRWADVQRLGEAVSTGRFLVRGADTGAVARALAPAPDGVVVRTAEEVVAEEAAGATRGVDVTAALVLAFGVVAGVVGVLVIANTLSVLLAQRQRDLALLRCVGASRRQVVRMVRREATVVGVLGATVGVASGWAGAVLLATTVGDRIPGTPLAEGVPTPWLGMAIAWVLGVLATVAASVFPARVAGRTSPAEALQPLGAVRVGSAPGAVRLLVAGVLVAGGVAGLALAWAQASLVLFLAAGTASFAGVLVLGPLLVPALVRLPAAPLARVWGAPARLAALSASRHPRRTAATAASLLVGTTLVTGVVTGIASVQGSVDREMDRTYPVDLALTARTGAGPLTAPVLDRVRSTSGVAEAVALRGTVVRVAGVPTTVVAAPGDPAVAHGSPVVVRPEPGRLYAAWGVLAALDLQPDSTLAVSGPTGATDVRVVGTEAPDGAVVVDAATLARIDSRAGVRAVWVRATERADAGELQAALVDLGTGARADVTGDLAGRAYVDLQLRVVVVASLALLGISLLIALLGIANTLGLSVLERTREHAALRAIGLTRGQLRGMLAAEAVLLSTVTGALGVALGLAYSWAGVHTVLEGALGESVALAVPWSQLALVVVAAGVAGLAACVLPARRAARQSPVAGLAAT